MSLDLTKNIKATFELATLKRDAKRLLTSKDWKTYEAIKQKHDAFRKVEQQSHIQEYDTRVEVAIKRLIAQAGAKQRDHKPRWAAHDRFDKTAITAQAHRNVQRQQAQVIAGIDEMEKNELSKLLKRTERQQKTVSQINDDHFERPIKQAEKVIMRQQVKPKRSR